MARGKLSRRREDRGTDAAFHEAILDNPEMEARLDEVRRERLSAQGLSEREINATFGNRGARREE